MKRSIDRILTKPVGSFHRPPTLENMMMAERKGEPVDPQELATEIQKAAADIVAMQIACGMDYVSDGEVAKISFMEYPYQRLSGFTGGLTGWVPPDILDFEDTRDFWYQSSAPYVELRQNDGPIQLVHPDLVQVDLANFRQALSAHQNVEGFLCAASPGVVGLVGTTFYQDESTFFHAIADAMMSEYRAILDAGYMLQLDIPDVTMIGAYLLQDRDLYRQSVQPRIEVLKYVLSNLPAEKIVLHACWGNWPGPHHRDTPLDWMIDLLLD
ncbi:MAG TPA: hypothetical protein VFN35_17910, partial [Ktedonobacteraceae bacterium]|nr:hypothetical protein [Ktedonobacteraceae bacterium]